MKKFLSAMFIFAAFMLVIGQNNSAAAGDVYLGSYLDGDEVYLMTETVKKIPAGADCREDLRLSPTKLSVLMRSTKSYF